MNAKEKAALTKRFDSIQRELHALRSGSGTRWKTDEGRIIGQGLTELGKKEPFKIIAKVSV